MALSRSARSKRKQGRTCSETAALSEAERRFHVRCHYRRPVREGDSLTDHWESCIVPFKELTCEKEFQRCWHFDYDRQAAALRAEIDKEWQEHEQAQRML